MSNLNVYYVSYFNDKSFFAQINKLGLMHKKKAFAIYRYVVDEEYNPSRASMAGASKENVVVGAS